MKKKEDKDGGILAFLQERKHASVEEICEKVYASPSTVRRRLTELQRKGLITRTHGGAQINDGNSFLPSFTFRSHQNSLEKKKIALSAIKLIKNGDVIFLDGSTSAFFIAEYLSEFENIKVLTNGIDTLSLLSRNGVTAYSTGGLISGENRSVLIGRVEGVFVRFHKVWQALRLSPLFGGGRGLHRHRPRHPQLFRAAAFSSRNFVLSAVFVLFGESDGGLRSFF